jgi:hypothetical protein
MHGWWSGRRGYPANAAYRIACYTFGADRGHRTRLLIRRVAPRFGVTTRLQVRLRRASVESVAFNVRTRLRNGGSS